jgi:catechol 2,3-dioxygenase-like lactoylglutathione lyase family enzyme
VITGAHFLLYSKDPESDRAFFRDVLGFRAVDVGHGWLIFAMPPAEAAIHPGSGNPVQDPASHPLLGAELYLMCDDLSVEIESLKARNVVCSPVAEERWGRRTTIRLPSGGEIGLYQPSHPTALDRP